MGGGGADSNSCGAVDGSVVTCGSVEREATVLKGAG